MKFQTVAVSDPERVEEPRVLPMLDKTLLSEAQEAVLHLMRRQERPLALDTLTGEADPQAEQELRTAVAQVVRRKHPELAPPDMAPLVDGILHEMRGFGPLEPLLQNRDAFEEIEVNRFDQVFVVPRGGNAELTPVQFRDDSHVRFVAQRLLSTVRRRVTEAEPLIDASLPGMRVNVVMAPVAVDGTTITIRLHHIYRGAADLVSNGTLTEDALYTLMALVSGGCHILVSGGTGTGKTTLLNVLSNFLPNWARIVTIEDAAELSLRPGNLIRMETRPPNIEGKGEITIRHLVRNAMRMRPDWIIVGEMRGAEALDVLTASNSGHAVFSTLHANTAEAGLHKLATYAAMSDEHLSELALAHQVASAFDAVVHMERQGSRRQIVQISEILGVDPVSQRIVLNDVFALDRGQLVPTGVHPNRWIGQLAQRGLPAPDIWTGEGMSA